MEQWKRNNPSLRIRDLEEGVIVVSDDEECQGQPQQAT